MEQHLWPSWFELRDELFSVSLDPYTLVETKRGLLPAGTLVESAMTVVHQAVARKIDIVTIRVRASRGANQIDVVQVGTEALRTALGL